MMMMMMMCKGKQGTSTLSDFILGNGRNNIFPFMIINLRIYVYKLILNHLRIAKKQNQITFFDTFDDSFYAYLISFSFLCISKAHFLKTVN